jgi:hypothetical protein
VVDGHLSPLFIGYDKTGSFQLPNCVDDCTPIHVTYFGDRSDGWERLALIASPPHQVAEHAERSGAQTRIVD